MLQRKSVVVGSSNVGTRPATSRQRRNQNQVRQGVECRGVGAYRDNAGGRYGDNGNRQWCQENGQQVKRKQSNNKQELNQCPYVR